ncbi:MAG: recombinase RecA [Planctomycetes bacterium]|nr:recombinase RecA [Planctomycetota bacterium]
MAVEKKEKKKKEVVREKKDIDPEKKAKEDTLKITVDQVQRKFGKGSLMQLGSADVAPVDSISTGALSLDLALGVKGVPKGRIVEIYGPESSGKTTLALHIIANAQKKGGMAAFIDAEHAMDSAYCQKLGVNINELYISQPDNGEQALDIAEMLVSSNCLDVLVIDSVAALVPKAELAGEMGDAHMGLQARLMSQALRKLTGITSKTNTCVIFINQLREKIGVFFGNPETTTGGRALKFYSSVRIEIRKISNIKKADDIIGHRVRAKVVKNKVAAPFREAEFDIYFGKGISWYSDILEQGVLHKVVDKSGSWYSYKDTKLGQGKENAVEYLEQNNDISQKIYEELINDLTQVFQQEAEEEIEELPETPTLVADENAE